MTYVTPSFSIQWQNPSPLENRHLPLTSTHSQPPSIKVSQPYDYFLVLDVEATCFPGTGFHWPNEIIVRYRARRVHIGSISYRNGPSVSSNGWTRELTAWRVPCKRLQNSAASSGRHGVPSYPPFVPLSLASLKSVHSHHPDPILTLRCLCWCL